MRGLKYNIEILNKARCENDMFHARETVENTVIPAVFWCSVSSCRTQVELHHSYTNTQYASLN